MQAALAKTMRQFFAAQAPKIASQIGGMLRALNKADITQDELDALDRVVAGVDFTGWAVLTGDMEEALAEIAQEGSYAALYQVGIDVKAQEGIAGVVNDDAVDYAKDRAAEMVGMRYNEVGKLVQNPNAEWQITEGTREYLRGAVEDAIVNGWSNESLAQSISDTYAFSDSRAMMIARTETNRASNIGALNGYIASGVVDGKEWLTADDDLVDEVDCAPNGDEGSIALDDQFQSGDYAPPAHPNCRCALAPVILSKGEV